MTEAVPAKFSSADDIGFSCSTKAYGARSGTIRRRPYPSACMFTALSRWRWNNDDEQTIADANSAFSNADRSQHEWSNSLAHSLAIVTGGSSGIGLELAKCFARDGHGVIIAAQNPAKLATAATALRETGCPRVETISVDLSKPDGPERLFHATNELGVVPDFLVNNAGVGVWGDFAETNLNAELALIQLNVSSVVALSKLYLRGMIERKHGRILITSSLGATTPTPKLSIYSASKAFTYSFSQAVAHELNGTGVTMTALLPGGTDTDIFRRADMEHTRLGASSKASASDVAQAGYRAMMRGDTHVVVPFSAKIAAAFAAITPSAIASVIAGEATKPTSN